MHVPLEILTWFLSMSALSMITSHTQSFITHYSTYIWRINLMTPPPRLSWYIEKTVPYKMHTLAWKGIECKHSSCRHFPHKQFFTMNSHWRIYPMFTNTPHTNTPHANTPHTNTGSLHKHSPHKTLGERAEPNPNSGLGFGQKWPITKLKWTLPTLTALPTLLWTSSAMFPLTPEN